LLATLFAIEGVAEVKHRLSPQLQQLNHSSDSSISVIAFLESEDIRAKAAALTSLATPRRRSSHNELLSLIRTENTGGEFAESLHELQQRGVVTNLREYWIAGAVAFEANQSHLAEIARLPGLYYLAEDAPLQLIEPVTMRSAAATNSGSWSGIDIIGARELWNQGYTGHGRLVCSFDTGVLGSHAALSDRWRGRRTGEPAAAWFDPLGSTEPNDNNGHGTHTMGLMVGRDEEDTIGVAFSAEWISAAVIDRGHSLSRTMSDILEAFQWAADPDGDPSTVDDLPDVVCHSWGIPRGLLPPCDETFWQAIDNLEALGIVSIFACGNEGPDSASIRHPADRASGPLNSFSVGAVDQTSVDLPVADFSSRGPAACGDSRIKPEVVAPGINIRSCYKDGGYKTISGTSMSAPLVAGVVALLREYNPDATVEQIKQALMLSATNLGPLGEDNDYGWGLINAARALEYLPAPQKPRLLIDETVISSADGLAQPGNSVGLQLLIGSEFVSANDVWAELVCRDSLVSLLIDSVSFGDVDIDELVANYDSPFLVKLHRDLPLGRLIEFTARFYDQNRGFLNSTDFTLISGQSGVAEMKVIESEHLSFELTNFGILRQLNYQNQVSDLLPLMSLIVADEQGLVYDAIGGDLDFIAARPLETAWFDGIQVNSEYRDLDRKFAVKQTLTLIDDLTADAAVIECELLPTSLGWEGEYQLAVAADVDLPGGELISYDGANFIYSTDLSSTCIGMRLLSCQAGIARQLEGENLKADYLNDSEKLSWLSHGDSGWSDAKGDWGLLAGPNRRLVTCANPLRLTLALAVADSRESVMLALEAAENFYEQPTQAENDDEATLPDKLTLEQNYPNPFNNETTIEFEAAALGQGNFEIYNALGQKVHSRIVTISAGRQRLSWDGTDQHGRTVASGVYYYRLIIDGNSQTRKMVLLK
jgi:subtilisin family serine protease